ncbi:MAG: UDP-N-acetyl-D-mannosamine dehydrogenase [Puniceicoccales bacterium]|jgi:UDP-N-acetyl-D-mannosaminuronic acid dehydrogenase|nr:UDP-N-acetyl-D-mannosamine dehydrogenase [Puniceicoccales bacterium]
MRYDICVLGLGYIGLPTASIFAARRKRVLGVDIAPGVVETINQGKIHIEEPDLDVLVKAAVQSGNLSATTAPAPADTYIIAVPTPFTIAPDGARKPGLAHVEAAARSLATVLAPGELIILESTSPVGTTAKIKEWLADEFHRLSLPDISGELRFAHCPERILPGQMLKELVSNDRIVGGLTPEAATQARELYKTFCTAEIFTTDAATAEMAKLAENAFRDVNIAFANELSIICEKIGVNVWELIRLANRHPRVKILQPGPGVGGHCIAVDPWFIVDAAPGQSRLIRTAREVNDAKPCHVIARALDLARASGATPSTPLTLACYGLAFKADVDDLRESPAVGIVQSLSQDPSLRILAVEPHITKLPKSLDSAKVTLTTMEDALARADMHILLVDHRPFKNLPAPAFRGKPILDTRGLWQAA